MKAIGKFANSELSTRPLTCSKHKLPYVLNKEQMVRILAAISDIRMGVVMFVGAFQGLRISEIVRLEWSDVDLFHGELRIRDAKNTKRFKSGYGRDRIVPINDMFLEVFQRWREMNPKEKYFVPRDNRYHENEKWTSVVRNYQKRFTDAMKRVGLREIDYYQSNGKPRYKYHLHTLRHVCGTNLYRAGMDLYQIQKFLGHEDIETTQVYCELARDDLKQASEIAYAYPKSRLAIPQNEEMVAVDASDTLRLQKEVLEKQIELMRLQNQEVLIQNGVVVR